MDASHQQIFSVGDLTQEVRLLLEASYPSIWVEGELSNLARPASGHLYFTLKDEKAQVRCAFFRNKMNRLDCKPENGMKVLIRARVSLYENRGDFQLIVSHLEESGVGNLQAAFEKLKLKLKSEGLFSADHKKPLPPYPQSIAVITSASGAVIKDIISTCKRRYPLVKLVLYPVQVQGGQAAAEIIQVLNIADANNHNVIIIGRGGGSLEDLWAFNDESLARALFACNTPVISAVGHETDFTIADFVADVRAPTPTAAAELATPDGDQLIGQFKAIQKIMTRLISHQLNHRVQQTDILTYRLTHPSKKLITWQQLNTQLCERLKSNIHNKIQENRLKINNLNHLVNLNSPKNALRQTRQRIDQLDRQLIRVIQSRLMLNQTSLDSIQGKLLAVSPQSTLERGYAIVTTNNQIVKSVKQVKSKSRVTIRLADGSFNANREN